jgi:16S rRNA (adenine1518-N6/adenine1519-N6)-dimethyltransferase
MEQVKAKKSLGQNFLKDPEVLRSIVEIAEIQAVDRILEIGPGTGALTEVLAATGAQVLAIELDHQLVERLTQHFIESDNVSILEGNILDVHLEEFLEHAGYESGRYKIVANIPYYITAPIIRTLLSLRSQASSITLMVQDAVADRLAAAPGSQSLLSVMAQYYADVEKKLFVSREAFDPVPAVDSAVVHLVPKRVYDSQEDRRVFRVVRAGFSARRKTLANNLANSFHLDRKRVEDMFASLGIEPMIRAQELSVTEWRSLAALVEKEIDAIPKEGVV